ncbi:hypothetical protein C8J57DRAFT_1738619 [Mycena rebaudengoi]|nr:hypothetical protein C8J57DRAFT_1738619 [Mycena rebaudengoi]
MPVERMRKPKDNAKGQASSLSTPRFRVSVNTGPNETPIPALGSSQLLEFRLDPPAHSSMEPAESLPPSTPNPAHNSPPFPHATLPVGSVYAPQAALRPFYPETPDFSPQTTPSFLHSASYYSPFYPAMPAFLPARQMVEAATQTDDPAAQLALTFGANLFDGIIPNTESAGGHRRQFKWPRDMEILTEDRLLVVLRAIKRAGFPTIGSFLSAIFAGEYNVHPTVYTTIASFLQAKERSVANHPVAIVDLIFRHRKSQEYVNGVARKPNFIIPRYALPPSIRRTSLIPTHLSNTTRNALIDWSLHRMIERFEKETKYLLQPEIGFLRRPGDPPLTWDSLLSWSMSQTQETIALNGPAIFTLFTTIAVNRSAREKLEAEAYLADHTDDSPDSTACDDGLPFAPEPCPAPIPVSHPGPSDQPMEPDGEDVQNEAEDDALDAPQIFIDPIGRRDPWQAVTVFIMALLVFRNRFALVFPILIGVFAFTCNAHREIIALLCRLGLSVSYSMVLAQLHILSVDSAEQLRVLGAFNPETGPLFLLLYDNVNKMKRAWRAHLGHKDEVKNGTASTAIKLEGVRPGAFLSEPLNKAIEEGKRMNLTVEQLQEDIDWDHMRGVGAGTIMRIFTKYIPSLSGHRGAIENLFSVVHKKHRLQLRKSSILAMRLSGIDESTTPGSAEVLQHLIYQMAILPAALFRWMIMICGDQLTIDRIRKIKWYTRKTDTPFDQHKRPSFVSTGMVIWAKNIFGLHHDCELLERGKFNHEKCDFYPAHHILEDRFEALVLEGFHVICQQQTGVRTAPTVKLTDAVQTYFGPEGHLNECSFETLTQLAETLYDRYISTAAGEDALGHCDRDVTIYGPAWEESAETDSEDEPTPVASSSKKNSGPPPKKKAKKSRAKANAKPARNYSKGDQVAVNVCHFMRVTFWYLELCAAIAEGDIGRVFEVIKLLRFSFWGAGSTNYGNELLELACNFLYEWSEDLRFTVLENYLVNAIGKIGHWFELDLLQEHHNFWIKNLFNSKSHDFDGKHLSEAVGLNITGISTLRERFPGLFGLKNNGQFHRKVSVHDDINRLGSHYHRDHTMWWESGRDQAFQVGSEFAEGATVLASGTLITFLSRTSRGRPINPEDALPEDGPTEPPCPTTVIEGVMGLPHFITGIPAA